MPSYAKISVIALAAVALAGCGGSYSNGGVKGATKTAQKFHTANVAGVGSVLVDAKGKTLYVLTSSSTKNVPCTAASGCTAVWPPVSPAYKGWRVYEYTGDSAPGQANGEGLKSFGGTWYALSPSGNPVRSKSGSSSSGSGGGGW